MWVKCVKEELWHLDAGWGAPACDPIEQCENGLADWKRGATPSPCCPDCLELLTGDVYSDKEILHAVMQCDGPFSPTDTLETEWLEARKGRDFLEYLHRPPRHEMTVEEAIERLHLLQQRYALLLERVSSTKQVH